MDRSNTGIAGDLKVYGEGSPGGKGIGLIMVSECSIPQIVKLKTRILSTSFFDHFRKHENHFSDEAIDTIREVVKELDGGPIGVRSSATDEAGGEKGEGDHLHSGDYRSFMLPNNHPYPEVRLQQVLRAITYIYNDFMEKQIPSSAEKMAIIINPVPGIFDKTDAGPCFYPCISGVANSYFPYALNTQGPDDGFARIAFGHGYATILDDFPIVSMATIRDPIPLKLLQGGNRQQYFYALNMARDSELTGDELATMQILHSRFASQSILRLLGVKDNRITLENLIQDDQFRFRTTLVEIMEAIKARITPHFQIEFVFNLDHTEKDPQKGVFHIVQLTLLPELQKDAVRIPKNAPDPILSIANSQGHGITGGIRHAVVVSPFIYSQAMHDKVRQGIAEINNRMKEMNERYVLIVPGRLGSANRDWGIFVQYREVSQAGAIFEYGVDIAGREEPLPERDSLTGGIYGSHFLYMIQGGHDEEKKRMRTRMYGTQGTHFLTNLMANNTVYGFISPAEDYLDPWFFTAIDPDEPISLLEFPVPVTIYADSIHQFCKVIPDHAN